MDKYETIVGRACDNCHKQSIKLMKCGNCKSAPYCSRECQKNHWPEHKKICGKDITLQPKKDVKNLGNSFIEELGNYISDILDVYDEIKKCSVETKYFIIASGVFNRVKNLFEGIRVVKMTNNEYKKLTKSDIPVQSLKATDNVYIIIFSERHHIMITGSVPTDVWF